jgi:hypothetical protein
VGGFNLCGGCAQRSSNTDVCGFNVYQEVARMRNKTKYNVRIHKLVSTAVILCIISSWGFGQNIRVPLTERMEDDNISKSLAILPVYVFQSDSIESNTMFGVERDKTEPKLVIKKFPNMAHVRDTGYTFIYFSGANNVDNKGYCLTLIGNFKRSRRTIFFFIDRNNNLDFTDDGEPDSMTYFQFETVFTFHNINNPQAQHQVRASRIEYGKNLKYKMLLTEHFKKHSEGRIFSDINYCYREQRLNTLGGVYRSDEDSFVLAIKDLNNNGLFNESCIDKIYIGSTKDQVNTDEMNWIQPSFSDIYFEWNKKRYQVVNIDPAGAYIEIRLVENAVLMRELKVGEKIPLFSFVNIHNEKEEIKSYKKKPVFIYFWSKDKLSAADSMYLRKIHEEYQDKIAVVALNYGDPPRSVRIIHFYDRIKWPIGFASYQIGRAFYLENPPRGYLVAKRLKMANDDVSPEEVYRMLLSNNLSSIHILNSERL